ncbi:hypothetical protein Zmor_008461 [Zophobas morio]|uniref:Uncharacterized protein n=1 Tax=Zophobas morio TaxID=2755281 RepID=A0AA38J0E2_9CUCU|nr:hypothetical protein Zmor_008461 [Zophobas morio]
MTEPAPEININNRLGSRVPPNRGLIYGEILSGLIRNFTNFYSGGTVVTTNSYPVAVPRVLLIDRGVQRSNLWPFLLVGVLITAHVRPY